MPQKSRNEWDWHTLLADQMTRHGRLYYTIAYGVLRDAAAAEDVCQQALLKALSKPQALRDDNALRPWLAKVVVNESLALRRRRKIEERVLAENRIPAAGFVPEGSGWELREAVLQAVEALPDPTRSIVVMRMLDGMTGNEVTDVLQCSESHVSRQLHLGMSLLRNVLKDWQTPANSNPKVR